MKNYMIPYVVEQTGKGERTYDIYFLAWSASKFLTLRIGQIEIAVTSL